MTMEMIGPHARLSVPYEYLFRTSLPQQSPTFFLFNTGHGLNACEFSWQKFVLLSPSPSGSLSCLARHGGGGAVGAAFALVLLHEPLRVVTGALVALFKVGTLPDSAGESVPEGGEGLGEIGLWGSAVSGPVGRGRERQGKMGQTSMPQLWW